MTTICARFVKAWLPAFELICSVRTRRLGMVGQWRDTTSTAYSGHRDHSVREIVITRSDDRDRSSERSDARAIVSSLDPPRNRM
jgi:hypothetical protein